MQIKRILMTICFCYSHAYFLFYARTNRDYPKRSPELKIRQVVLFIHRPDFSSAFCVQIAQLLRNHDSKLVDRPREFPEIIKRKNC